MHYRICSYFLILFYFNMAWSQMALEKWQSSGFGFSRVDFAFSYCALSDRHFFACMESLLQVLLNLGHQDHGLIVSEERPSLGPSGRVFTSLANEESKLAQRYEYLKAFYHSSAQEDVQATALAACKYVKGLFADSVYEAVAAKVFYELLIQHTLDPYYALRDPPGNVPPQDVFGFGVRVWSHHGENWVTGVLEGSPAARAGLQPFDRILEVNGVSVSGQNLILWEDQLRSAEPGKPVIVIVERLGRHYSLRGYTDRLKPGLYQLVEEESFLRLKISNFDDPDLCQQIKAELEGLDRHKPLEIDLRFNPGGLKS